MSAPRQGKKKLPATYILLGLLIGAVAGVAANRWLGASHAGLKNFVDSVAQPVGQIFLRLLFMVVVPLVFSSLVLGVAGLGNLGSLGRIGFKTLSYFVITTAIAAAVGITLINTVHPGRFLSREKAEAIRQESSGEATAKIEQGKGGTGFGAQTFVNIVPKNPIDSAAKGDMLALIFFALMVGIAATTIPKDKATPFLGFLEGLNAICGTLIEYAMKLAPLGVAALIFSVTARFGTEILQALSAYVLVVLFGLAFHQFIVLGLAVRWLVGMNPIRFFARCRGLMATAFGTSSSSATLPTTIKTAVTEFGVPPKIAGFVLPLGATLNMNGTALFEGCAVLFLAEVAGVDLSLGMQLLVIGLAVLTAVGAAGVPGGSLPLLALVLERVGVPPEMLAVILGVDRVIDMARTVPNVTGDLTAALFVARSEGEWKPDEG